MKSITGKKLCELEIVIAAIQEIVAQARKQQPE